MGGRAAKSSRQQRAEEYRRAQERTARRRTITIVAVIAAVVLVAGGAVAWAIAGAAPAPASASLGAVQTFSGLSRNHTTGKVDYPQTPPVGGDHSPVWLNCGYYDSPVPNENAVHDLEHGAVWITYRPGLPAAQIARLRDLADQQTYLTVSPYPGLPSPVVASAWGVQLQLPNASDPRLTAFVRKYVQGPQTPEPGAPCTGGVGTPSG